MSQNLCPNQDRGHVARGTNADTQALHWDLLNQE